jgi:hypothetical protein
LLGVSTLERARRKKREGWTWCQHPNVGASRPAKVAAAVHVAAEIAPVLAVDGKMALKILELMSSLL